MKIIRRVIMVVIVLAAVITGWVLKTYYDAGEFKTISLNETARCNTVPGVLSSEDITIDQGTGVAFISSADRRTPISGDDPVKKGAIYGIDLNGPDRELVDLTAGFDKGFNPHGIGLWTGDNGPLTLFAVNHRKDGHFVEVFEYKDNRLVHRESIEGALMHSPNDVIPVGPRSFYVTNDHGNTSKWGRLVEEYLQLARSQVLYYDGNRFRVVAQGLAYANGINVSPDGRTVYVAATIGRKVYVYRRNESLGDLSILQTIDLGTGPDNIEVDEKGRLWIGCHPKLLTFVKYSKDPATVSPSQIIRITLRPPKAHEVDEVYLNRGEPLSGASVAAVYRDNLLIGSVFDPRFLLCRLTE